MSDTHREREREREKEVVFKHERKFSSDHSTLKCRNPQMHEAYYQ
jgi:hypothetical protein